jgi:polyribonucleotide nucleotidyltransferase
LEFEKENNNILKFLVPTRSVSRILGRGGATINEIKANTDAQIDVEKISDEGGVNTQVIVRGTKDAVAAAKAAILTISDQIGEEVTVSLMIDNKLHRTLIGPGGQGLRDLVIRCGGPSDSKLHAGLIRL